MLPLCELRNALSDATRKSTGMAWRHGKTRQACWTAAIAADRLSTFERMRATPRRRDSIGLMPSRVPPEAHTPTRT